MSTPESKVSFMHIRPLEVVGMPNGDKECPATKGGTTVAYEITPTEGTQFVVHYAVASCHPTDNYNRQQGRAKAAGRLQSVRFRKSFAVDDKDQVIQKLTQAVNLDLLKRRADAMSAIAH